MANRVPFFFSAFCSLMVGSTMLRTSAGVALAGVGTSAADKAQMIVAKLGSAAGFTAPEIAPNLEPVSSGAGFTQVNFQAANAENDPVTVGIANAVSTSGVDDQFPAARVRALSIPFSGSGTTVRAKKKNMPFALPNGGQRMNTVWVITTDKRYVVYHRGGTVYEVGVSVTEARSILGARMWRADGSDTDVEADLQVKMADKDRAFWAEQLLPRVASTGT